MDWVRNGGLVILSDGSVSEMLNISEDNGIRLLDHGRWYCRTELLPLTKENVVKTLNGVLPPEPIPVPLMQDLPYTFFVYDGNVFCKWRIAIGWSNKKICTVLEFKQLAKELNKEKQMTDWYDYEKKTAITFPPVGSEVIVYTREISRDFWPDHHLVKVIAVDGDNIVYKHQDEYYSNGLYAFKPLDWEKDVRKNKLIETVCKLILDMGGVSFNEAFTKLYDLGYLKFPEDK